MCATLCNKAVMVLIKNRHFFETIDQRSRAWCDDAKLDVVSPICDVL